MNESAALSTVKGVGKKTEELFQRLGVYSLRDILLFFPRAYEKYPAVLSSDSELSIHEDENVAVLGMFVKSPATRTYHGLQVTTGIFTGRDIQVDTVWYRSAYLQKQIVTQIPYVCYGKLKKKGNRYRLEQPKLFEPGEYESLTRTPQPIYPLTKGLTQKTIVKVLKEAMNTCFPVQEILPQELMVKNHLMDRSKAIYALHFPQEEQELVQARNRFSYEEFLSFFLAHQFEKQSEVLVRNEFRITKHALYDQVRKNLPFKLTDGQDKALADLMQDFAGEQVKERLIQGDVGSGKTILAFLAMTRMAENGYQCALMAPTEVLAEQHQKSMEEFIERHHLPFKSVLLTGKVKGKAREAVLSDIQSGTAQFIIGTHALIQDGVEYQNLSLVITDEQHRFGVKQRSKFGEKGQHPFSVVMSATPIPRTLALILYEGMNVSVIADVPSSRIPIKTAVMPEKDREKAQQFVISEVKKGHQAYIICPLVEETENSSGENVTDYSEDLRKKTHGQVSIGMLHGRMKPEEKDQVMEDFSSGKIQVLVSTTVVEVGVNVPNATVIMIENADRFGLSQLHQLRGRVGRSDLESFCILMNSSNNEKSESRLKVIQQYKSGFDIAEKDLELRGPGDISGIEQSGDLPFIFADLFDQDMMQRASQDAKELLEKDPELKSPEHQGLYMLCMSGVENIYTNL